MKVTDFDLKTLVIANRNASAALQVLNRRAYDMEQHSDAYLNGLLGGICGVVMAYLLALLLPVPFAGLSVVGAASGIGLAMYWHYQHRAQRIDTQIAANKLSAEEILARIRSLPKNAPEEIREELWLMYRELNNKLAQAASKRPEPVAELLTPENDPFGLQAASLKAGKQRPEAKVYKMQGAAGQLRQAG